MKNKNECSYENFPKKIKEVGQLNPSLAVFDFKKALWNAIKFVFSNSKVVIAFFIFHNRYGDEYKQNVCFACIKKMMNLGI